jgi:hypothetical protein
VGVWKFLSLSETNWFVSIKQAGSFHRSELLVFTEMNRGSYIPFEFVSEEQTEFLGEILKVCFGAAIVPVVRGHSTSGTKFPSNPDVNFLSGITEPLTIWLEVAKVMAKTAPGTRMPGIWHTGLRPLWPNFEVAEVMAKNSPRNQNARNLTHRFETIMTRLRVAKIMAKISPRTRMPGNWHPGLGPFWLCLTGHCAQCHGSNSSWSKAQWSLTEMWNQDLGQFCRNRLMMGVRAIEGSFSHAAGGLRCFFRWRQWTKTFNGFYSLKIILTL